MNPIIIRKRGNIHFPIVCEKEDLPAETNILPVD